MHGTTSVHSTASVTLWETAGKATQHLHEYTPKLRRRYIRGLFDQITLILCKKDQIVLTKFCGLSFVQIHRSSRITTGVNTLPLSVIVTMTVAVAVAVSVDDSVMAADTTTKHSATKRGQSPHAIPPTVREEQAVR